MCTRKKKKKNGICILKHKDLWHTGLIWGVRKVFCDAGFQARPELDWFPGKRDARSAGTKASIRTRKWTIRRSMLPCFQWKAQLFPTYVKNARHPIPKWSSTLSILLHAKSLFLFPKIFFCMGKCWSSKIRVEFRTDFSFLQRAISCFCLSPQVPEKLSDRAFPLTLGGKQCAVWVEECIWNWWEGRSVCTTV